MRLKEKSQQLVKENEELRKENVASKQRIEELQVECDENQQQINELQAECEEYQRQIEAQMTATITLKANFDSQLDEKMKIVEESALNMQISYLRTEIDNLQHLYQKALSFEETTV